jgi:nicotinate-nucleotide adenylyltransferase
VKIGVFGGTFDPIHWGHLVLAEEALLAAGLDRILFVPSGLPPHKIARVLTSCAHRLEMVRLAVAGVPAFEVSDVEADEGMPHYSLDTLARLARERPRDEISFLLGSDSLLEMKSWRDPEGIARLCPLVVLPRPGFDAAAADPAFTRRLTLVRGVSVSISSTLVRQRLAGDAPVRFLVPEPVREYIRRHRLYRATP